MSKDAVILVDVVKSGIESALLDADFACRTLTVDEALDLKLDADAVIIGETVTVDDGRLIAERARQANKRVATFVLVEGYSPDAVGRVLDLDVDAFLHGLISDRELVRMISREVRTRRTGAGERDRIKVPQMVGSSEPMRDLCRTLARTAPSTMTVLITGESGTGKELVARSIHRLSPRRDRAFIAVNCGAIPETLVESELFGHEKGAFTGASARAIGKFEAADGGTLFLDEIGELPLDMQVKLLRVLEEREVRRVGGTEPIDIDVRLVCATNRDLQDEVEAGRFRKDLRYRIDVLRIETPPLRNRRSDIEKLWQHFVERAAEREGRPVMDTSQDVIRLLMRYDWPGNVRELQNLAHQAVVRRTSGKITPRIVRDRLRAEEQGEEGNATSAAMTAMLRPLEEIERDAIINAYLTLDSVKEAADVLGISERKFYYRLKQYREQGFLRDPSQSVPSILLAHADSGETSALTQLLQRDFEVQHVPDGVRLLDYVYNGHPDALIVQHELPILSGLNVLELAYEQGWDIPVVLLGRTDDATTRDYAEALGALAFMEPPYDQLSWVLDTALRVTTA